MKVLGSVNSELAMNQNSKKAGACTKGGSSSPCDEPSKG